MDLHRKANGKWELRWREAGRYASRTFDRKKDAEQFDIDRRRRKQLGQAAIPADVPLSEFAKTYWRLHAIPNLAESTRDFYARTLSNHIIPRLGDYGVRELTPKRLARFRESLEREAGTATVRKAMAILQSILSFAVAEELVEFNAAAAVRKPRYERAREPQILLPAEVERIRDKLASLRDRTLVGRTRVFRPTSRGGRLPPRVGRHRRTRDPLPRHQAPPRALHATPRTAGRGPARVVPRVWDAPSAPRRCFQRTTEGSGKRTTGQTGAAAYGSRAQSVGTSVTGKPKCTAEPLAVGLRARVREISVRATSRCAYTRGFRSQRSGERWERASR